MKKNLFFLSIVALLLVGVVSCGPTAPKEKNYSETEYQAAMHSRDSALVLAKSSAEALTTARNDLVKADSAKKNLARQVSSLSKENAALVYSMQNYKVTTKDYRDNEHTMTYR